jgi:hypothetical protein
MRIGPIPWIELLEDWIEVPGELGRSETTCYSLDGWMIRTTILVLVRIRTRHIYHLEKEVGHQVVASLRCPFAQRMLHFHFRLLEKILMVLHCMTDYLFEMG